MLSSEKTKFARTEDKLANLERDLANREKQWEIKEKELRDTITELRANLGKKAELNTSCQSEAASSFAKVVSNEGTYFIILTRRCYGPFEKESPRNLMNFHTDY